jgi:hypothetical protein
MSSLRRLARVLRDVSQRFCYAACTVAIVSPLRSVKEPSTTSLVTAGAELPSE